MAIWLERGDEAMNLNAMDEIVIAVNQFGMPACITRKWRYLMFRDMPSSNAWWFTFPKVF
jgi:hypothetical protein